MQKINFLTAAFSIAKMEACLPMIFSLVSSKASGTLSIFTTDSNSILLCKNLSLPFSDNEHRSQCMSLSDVAFLEYSN